MYTDYVRQFWHWFWLMIDVHNCLWYYIEKDVVILGTLDMWLLVIGALKRLSSNVHGTFASPYFMQLLPCIRISHFIFINLRCAHRIEYTASPIRRPPTLWYFCYHTKSQQTHCGSHFGLREVSRTFAIRHSPFNGKCQKFDIRCVKLSCH